MRSELIELEEVGIYNEWVVNLRKKVLGGQLGGDRKELWREVGKNRVGLVENKEVEVGRGGVDEEEARKVSLRFFLSSLFRFLVFPFMAFLLHFSFPTHFFPLSYTQYQPKQN